MLMSLIKNYNCQMENFMLLGNYLNKYIPKLLAICFIVHSYIVKTLTTAEIYESVYIKSVFLII